MARGCAQVPILSPDPAQLTPPLVWAFASTATSLSKVAPANSPVGFAHVFLKERRKRNRCGTKDFVLNPFPWNFFGPLKASQPFPQQKSILDHRERKSLTFSPRPCSPGHGKQACAASLTSLCKVPGCFLGQTVSFREIYDLCVPDFGSVLSKHRQGAVWMNTQVGARAGFLEGRTFELGLEGAQGLRGPRGKTCRRWTRRSKSRWLQVESGRQGWASRDGDSVRERSWKRGKGGVPSQDLEKWGSSHSAACLHPAPRVERWSTQPGRQWTRTIPAPCDRGWAGKGVPGGPRQGGEGYIGSGMFDLRWEGAGWDPRCPCPRQVGERGCWKGSKQRHVTGSQGVLRLGHGGLPLPCRGEDM